MDLVEQWKAALADVELRHPNGFSRVDVSISMSALGAPMLRLALDKTRDSTTPDRVLSPFVISNVELMHFPGDRVARAWLAAAFAGYLQHEALELVTIRGERILDPHAAPFTCDRGLRAGLPVRLTPESLIESLAVVMGRENAEAYVAA